MIKWLDTTNPKNTVVSKVLAWGFHSRQLCIIWPGGMLFLPYNTLRIPWIIIALLVGDVSNAILGCVSPQFERLTQIQSPTQKKKITFQLAFWHFPPSENTLARGGRSAAEVPAPDSVPALLHWSDLIWPLATVSPENLMSCVQRWEKRATLACRCLLAKPRESSAINQELGTFTILTSNISGAHRFSKVTH